MAKINLNRHIFLIGLPLVGKTSLIQELSLRFDLDCIDLDKFICMEQKSSIEAIWNQSGMGQFRTIERRALFQIMTKPPAIIGSGGGTPCFFDNMMCMNEYETIYLYADPELIKDRINEHRPMFLNKELSQSAILHKLYDERHSIYNRAKYRFDVHNNFEQNVDSFISFLLVQELIKLN